MQEGFDGQKQRAALTAAERALRAVAAGDAAKARASARKAAELDQIGTYSDFVRAIEPVAQKLDTEGPLEDADWDGLAESLGMGPVAGLIEELRRETD